MAAFLWRAAGTGNRGFGAAGLWSALGVSLQASTISLALITFTGVPLAYVLARHPGRLAGAIAIVVQLPLALPPLMSGILLVYLVGPYSFLGRHSGGRLTDTLGGVVIAQSFVSAPFLVVSARSAFAAVDPALRDVAATLGHRPLARFLRVDVRSARAGIRAGMVLTWLRAFGEYGATLIIAYHPFSLPIFLDNQFDGYPLSTTEAPTLIALAVAALAVVAGQVRLGRRRRPVVLPAGRPPARRPPVAVGFDLDVRAGTFHLAVASDGRGHRLALVGPSGSGKSMTLRALTGLLGPGAGRVTYAGVDVTLVPTERRRIGYVPQGFGLIPDRTVWQQVVFGRGADRELAAWWVRTLHLEDLVDRTPEQLSGGQRQRVSLARALATEPDVVLLDEPFSALDAPVRAELRRELRRLQHSTGLSTVLVTHDPEEAAILSDELLVVAAGRPLQAGVTPGVFRRPATLAVGRLLGVTNLCDGRIDPDGRLRTGSLTLPATTVPAGESLPAGTAVLWRAPPERVRIEPDGRRRADGVSGADGLERLTGEPAGRRGDGGGGGPGGRGGGDDLNGPDGLGEPAGRRGDGGSGGPGGRGGGDGDGDLERLTGEVLDVIDLGRTVEVTARIDGGPELVARSDGMPALRPGQRCRVLLDPADVAVWAADDTHLQLRGDRDAALDEQPAR